MSKYREISPESFNESTFKLIGKDWMLITVKDESKESKANAMTASWGGLGVLWNTPVATVYIRPQRYTYSLAENNDRMALCFPDERFRKALGYCGSKSGKDTDKLKDCGLGTEEISGIPVISDSRVIMLCKKLYADDLKESAFVDKEHLSHYNGDFHRFYILEIEKILIKD